jgi:hypothetical protein
VCMCASSVSQVVGGYGICSCASVCVRACVRVLVVCAHARVAVRLTRFLSMLVHACVPATCVRAHFCVCAHVRARMHSCLCLRTACARARHRHCCCAVSWFVWCNFLWCTASVLEPRKDSQAAAAAGLEETAAKAGGGGVGPDSTDERGHQVKGAAEQGAGARAAQAGEGDGKRGGGGVLVRGEQRAVGARKEKEEAPMVVELKLVGFPRVLHTDFQST